MFQQKGIFLLENNFKQDLEQLELELIDFGAEDIQLHKEQIEVTTSKENFGTFNKLLEKKNINILNSQLQRIPIDSKMLALEKAKKIVEILDIFEEIEEVQNIFHTMEMTEELISFLEKQY